MAVQSLDNVLVVVDDLDASIAFFEVLGLELAGIERIEGDWVDRVVGLDDVRQQVAMLRTPDGSSGIELVRFDRPEAVGSEPAVAPVNTLGIRRVMFAVDDIDDTVARLQGVGAELVRDIAQYEKTYRLCYVRGPEGILVGLAEPLS